ncbi:hypothetical protein M231_05717 [Tremella mesenterica]|uniref:DUF676 domain-containing protein n=1 Tax=Tremella mesenterica TaxID=5217 RepID=A0A4Q1BHE4_TREME|nr:hypothetical protein M231_05717 [Tremella mesenterica]
MSTNKPTRTHLILLLHGLYGSPDNLTVCAQELNKATSKSSLQVKVLVAKSYMGSHTWDGIDINARRVYKELHAHIDLLKKENQEVTAFSIMGYSLGGCIARYLLGLLAMDPGFFKRHEPVGFSTFASPYLGVLKYRTRMNTFVHSIGRRVLSRTGQQLYMLDKDHGRPLLSVLADPDLIFLQTLKRFPRILVIANGCHDLTVPYPTATFSLSDPFVDYATNGLMVETDPDHVVTSFRLPGRSSTSMYDKHNSSFNLKNEKLSNDDSRPSDGGTQVNRRVMEENNEEEEDHEEDEVEDLLGLTTQTRVVEQVRKRHFIPPVFVLPYPFPFSHLPLLIAPIWFLFAIIVALSALVLIAIQSQYRLRSLLHPSSEHTPLLTLSKPYLSNTSSDPSHSLTKHLENKKDRSITSTPSRFADSESSSRSTSPLYTESPDSEHSSLVPLLLTEEQKVIVRNLNGELPQVQKVVAWFPYAFNSHAMLIVRSGARFPWQEDARGLVRRWAEWMIDGPSTI